MKGVMHEFKHGELHSGSSKGPVVASRKQAIAIGLSEQRQQGKKVPPKPAKSGRKGRPYPGLGDSHPPGSISRAPRPVRAPKTLAGRRDASHAKAYPDEY